MCTTYCKKYSPNNVIMSAVKETLQQQTGCLHYGRHDNYAFFQNAGK